jgi:hypothetical protein
MLKLPQIAQNIEMLLGGFFDSTYNEHRGPIQIVHQIERVRSNEYFENNDFYQLIAESEFKRDGSFNHFDRALDIVDANTRGWRGTTIGRKIELAAAGRWMNTYVNLGDAVWATYLHIASGGAPTDRAVSVLSDAVEKQVHEDGVFHYSSDFSVNSLEGKTVIILADQAIKRLKLVS